MILSLYFDIESSYYTSFCNGALEAFTKRAIAPPIKRPNAPSTNTHNAAVNNNMKHSNLSRWNKRAIIFLGTNLQALVIRIEAITGIGIYVKHGRRSNITINTITPFIN